MTLENNINVIKKSIENPLISVITVVYNGEKYIENTILNVINQTYNNIEYIIIDGGSNDGTLAILKKYERFISYWVSESDKGIYDAMNKGIAIAKGELIGIVNSDDWYELNTAALVVDKYRMCKDVDVFHGNISKCTQNGTFLKIMKPVLELDKIYTDMIYWHPTFFVKKSLYNKIGDYSIKYKVAGDYDFLMRCYKEGISFGYINEVLTNFRVGGASSSSAFEGFRECRDIANNEGVNRIYTLYIYYKRCIIFLLAQLINPYKHHYLDQRERERKIKKV